MKDCKPNRPVYMVIALIVGAPSIGSLSEHDTLAEAHARRRAYIREGIYQEGELDVWKKEPSDEKTGFGEGDYG